MPLPIPIDLHNRVTEIISPTANCAASRAQHPGPTAHAVEIVTLVTSANMHQDAYCKQGLGNFQARIISKMCSKIFISPRTAEVGLGRFDLSE